MLGNLFDRVQDKWELNNISMLLTQWSREPRLLSLEQDRFQSNVCRFVESKTGKSAISYEEAVRLLRDMSVVKNEQSRVLYDAFKIQRTEIARQQQIITCLTYRFALEHLPQKGADIMTKTGGAGRTDSATGAWQKMWRLAVEAELDRMLVEYIDPKSPLLATPTTSGTTSTTGLGTGPATGSAAAVGAPVSVPTSTGTGVGAATTTTAQASAPVTTVSTTGVTPIGATPAVPGHNTSTNSATVNTPKPSHSLKKLLQSDFNFWTSNQRSNSKQGSTSDLEVAKTNKLVPTGAGLTGGADVPAGVAILAGVKVTKGKIALATFTAQPPSNGASWWTGKYLRVECYKPPYDKWPSFSHGHTLYGELSNNIHTYEKSYAVDETNFTKSQRTVLEWLAPRDLGKTVEDGSVRWEAVDWEKQWTKRGLITM